MKISVICITSRSGGGLTVLRSLINYARDVDTQHEWQFVLSDQEVGDATGRVHIVHACAEYRGWRSRLRGELIVGRRAVKDFGPDVVLSLHNTDTLARAGHPLAVYVQQALPFQRDYKLSVTDPRERSLAWRQYLLRYPILHAVRKAVLTVVQTKWMAEELTAAVPTAQVASVGFGRPDHGDLEYGETVRENGFFYPAAPSSYKNHRTLLEAVQILRGCGVEAPVALTTKPDALGVSEELDAYEFLGWISHDEVLRRYEDSILVFPSLVESLGLPLYEARDAGVWIVAADTAYAREALDGYPTVAWFAPTDPQSMANAMADAWSASREPRKRITDSSEATDSWGRLLQELNARF